MPSIEIARLGYVERAKQAKQAYETVMQTARDATGLTRVRTLELARRHHRRYVNRLRAANQAEYFSIEYCSIRGLCIY